MLTSRLCAIVGQLVYQTDVDRAECVFQEFDEFGLGRRADANHLIEHRAVDGFGAVPTGLGHAAEDFRDVGWPVGLVSWIDAFRREGDEDVVADGQPVFGQRFGDELLGCPRVHRTFENNGTPFGNDLGELLDGAGDVREVRRARLPHRRWHTDRDGVDGFERRVLRCRLEAGFECVPDSLVFDVVHVGVPRF